MTVTLCRLSMRCRALRVAQSQSSRWTRATVSHVSSPSWKRAGLKPSFQQGASHPRKKGLFPPVGSNWMRDTTVSAVRQGRHLVPHSKPNAEGFKVYRSSIRDCRQCPLRADCFSPNAQRRTVLLNKDHPALLRARRRHLAWTERERILYASHRARVEGVHGEEKAWHGLARAVRRGLANMKIQAYLTAAAVNLKRLAAAVAALLLMLLPIHRQSRSCTAP